MMIKTTFANGKNPFLTTPADEIALSPLKTAQREVGALGKSVFENRDVRDAFKIQKQTATKKIEKWVRVGAVKNVAGQRGAKGSKIYEVDFANPPSLKEKVEKMNSNEANPSPPDPSPAPALPSAAATTALEEHALSIGANNVIVRMVADGPRFHSRGAGERGKYVPLFERLGAGFGGLSVETRLSAYALYKALRTHIKKNNLEGRARVERWATADYRIFWVKGEQ